MLSTIKLLRNEEILTVDGKGSQVLKIYIDNEDNNIGISVLYKENDLVKITLGPSSELEGQIIKIDAGKGKVKVG